MQFCSTCVFAGLIGSLLVVSFVVWVTGRRPQDCSQTTQWGNNACSLHGTLEVFSAPSQLPVTAKHCNLFYNKTEFFQQPLVVLPDAHSDGTYTVVMVDADAPGYPEGKYFLHWIAANIKGKDFIEGDLNNATFISTYYPPAPPKGSGTHRYVLLAYRQSASFSEDLAEPNRTMFDLAAWALPARLCGPVSGRQFRTSFSGN